MLKPSHIVFIFCLWLYATLVHSPAVAQAPAVLSDGTWYKIAVTSDGVYRLSGDFLQEQGISLSGLKPENVGIFGYGGGMLPQPLAEPRYADLPEIGLWITGAEDGSFDAADQIIFYAQGPDRQGFEVRADGQYALNYQKNLYADTAFYFLTLEKGSYQMPESRESLPPSGAVMNTFDDFWIHELDETNLLKPGSGREWYGENFFSGDQLTFDIDAEGLSPQGTLQLSVEVLGSTTASSVFEVLLNRQSLGEISITPILGGTYTDKGKEAVSSFNFPANALSDDLLNLQLRYRASEGRGQAYLNRLLLHYPRQLRLYGGQTHFRSLQSLSTASSDFVIASSKEDLIVWDVTDPIKPLVQETTFLNGSLRFSCPTAGQLKEFVVFDREKLEEPEWLGTVANQDLNSLQVPDLLIVCPPQLSEAARRLATLRREHDRLDVEVATTVEIYNQFASGRQDVSAIRNFVKTLYDRDPDKFKYLLLLGKASYDYKDRVEDNTNLVPTYQSRNSVHPIYSYPSDDYYAFMEDEEGYWEESFRGDHSLDIGVGRLPVKNLQEANQVIDKLIHYALSERSLGDWRTKVTFLADDGDNDRYQRDSELLSADVQEKSAAFNSNKIYLDAFPQQKFPNQEIAPSVNEAVEDAIEAGTLLFNYVGHGNEQRLADENVLNVGMIEDWTNLDRLPFFVTATCEFGRHDDPERISGAERLVLNPRGGAVGMVTTARPVFSNTNYLLNQAFYRFVFEQQDNDFLRIGDIFRKTKNAALNGRDNRNFALLADPSMRLSYPRHQLRIDSILSVDRQQKLDTVAALSHLRLYGSVLEGIGQSVKEDFDGELTLVLHDKAVSVQTRGNEGTVMQFKELNNVIHRGKASVNHGLFQIELVVPKNINYQTAAGRISLYARANDQLTDAFGGTDSIYIGGSLSPLPEDDVPPEISLFINDTTFVNGGLSGNQPIMLARLWDEQGINLSRQQLGQEIRAELSRVDAGGGMSRELILNDFFVTAKDDHQRGLIEYPLGNIENGKYRLTLKASDTHNNPASASIEFVVSSNEELLVQNFYNFPNPFNQSTTFVLEHNLAGEPLHVTFSLFNILGKEVISKDLFFENAAGRLEILRWQPENQASGTWGPGVYLAKIRLKAKESGQEAQQNLRIILTN